MFKGLFGNSEEKEIKKILKKIQKIEFEMEHFQPTVQMWRDYYDLHQQFEVNKGIDLTNKYTVQLLDIGWRKTTWNYDNGFSERKEIIMLYYPDDVDYNSMGFNGIQTKEDMANQLAETCKRNYETNTYTTPFQPKLIERLLANKIK